MQVMDNSGSAANYGPVIDGQQPGFIPVQDVGNFRLFPRREPCLRAADPRDGWNALVSHCNKGVNWPLADQKPVALRNGNNFSDEEFADDENYDGSDMDEKRSRGVKKPVETEDQLKNMKSKKNIKLHSCPVCGKEQRSVRSLTMHVGDCRRNLEEEIGFSSATGDAFVCLLCLEHCATELGLESHILAHADSTEMPCKFCIGGDFGTGENLVSHMRQCHADLYPPKCNSSPNSVHSDDEDEHVEVDVDDEPTFGQMNGSIKEEHDAEEELKIADDSADDEPMDFTHEKNSTEAAYRCDNCPSEFGTASALTLHVISKHASIHSTIGGLDLRQRSDSDDDGHGSGTESPAMSAGNPNRTFGYTDGETSNDGSKDYNSGTPNHASFSQSMEFPFLGDDEDPEITGPHDMSAEIREMKLKGEFPCRLCTMIFPNLRALKGHNRTHLNSAPYMCNMCPYSSTDKSTLIRHMRTHNGDRPFQCKLCQYAFTTKANCERHLRNRHGQKTRDDIRRSITFHHSEAVDGEYPDVIKRTPETPVRRENAPTFKPTAVFPGSMQEDSDSGSQPLAHSSPVPIEIEPDLSDIVRPHDFRIQADDSSNSAENPLDLTKPARKPVKMEADEEETKPQDLSTKNGGSPIMDKPSPFPMSPVRKEALRLPQVGLAPMAETPFPLYMGQYGPRPAGNFMFYHPTSSGPVPVPVPVPVPPFGMMGAEEANPSLLMDLKNYFEKVKRDLAMGPGGLMPGLPPDMAFLATDPRFYACWKDYMGMAHRDVSNTEDNSAAEKDDRPILLPTSSPSLAKMSVTMPSLKPTSPSLKTSVQASGTVRIPSGNIKEVPVANLSPEDASMVKLVIKNGVLMRKQKQRRYRTERPFVCEHCSARFTLRSNMERHIKQQHPQFWSQKPRGGRRFPGLSLPPTTILKEDKIMGMDVMTGETVLPEMEKPKITIATPVFDEPWANLSEKMMSLADAKSQLKRIIQQESENGEIEEPETGKEIDESFDYDQGQSGDESEAESETSQKAELVIDEDSNDQQNMQPKDLASVKKLLVQANSQNFQEFFKPEEDEDQKDDTSSQSSFDIREDSMTSEQRAENFSISESSTSPAPGSDGVQPVEKKKSAYSSAPHKVSCPYCQRKFPWTSSLRRHVLTHTGQKPFKCSVCPLLFTTKSNCDRHLLRKHGHTNQEVATSSAGKGVPGLNSVDKVYTCTMCPSANFSTSAALEKHRLRMHFHAFGSDDGNGTCSSDDDRKEDKKKDIKAIPNLIPVKTFLCPVKDCMQVFKSANVAITHICKSHNGQFLSKTAEPEEEPADETPLILNAEVDSPAGIMQLHSCCFCLKSFASASDLYAHSEIHKERTESEEKAEATTSRKRKLLAEAISRLNGCLGDPSGVASKSSKMEGQDEPGSDLIGNLLGINDKDLIDQMLLSKSADDAAKLLGVQGQG